MRMSHLKMMELIVKMNMMIKMKGDRQETFQSILVQLKPLLDKVGTIRSDDAWKVCKVKWGYSTITTVFRTVMFIMEKNGDSKRVQNGVWKIMNANSSHKLVVPLKEIKSYWNLPSFQDGNSFMTRSDRAEKDLRSALDLLEKVKEEIPHTPATSTKQRIEDFLKGFRK